MECSKDNVHIAGFGIDCFSVTAPTGTDINKLTEFLKKTGISRREHFEFSYKYEYDIEGLTAYVFNESGRWV